MSKLPCLSWYQTLFSSLLFATVLNPSIASAGPSVARQWDEQLLHAISIDTARPTVHARNLFNLSTAMYDAWAAFDTTATQYVHHEKPTAVDVEAARNEAVSYAAYNLIKHRFVSGPAGCIHPPADDFSGRRIGHIVGPDACALALRYFSGEPVPEPASALLAGLCLSAMALLHRPRFLR